MEAQAGAGRRAAVAGGLAAGLAGLVRPAPAVAKQVDPKTRLKSRDNPYANVKKASAVDAYSSSGGACGPGYKLEVKKVLGSSCVCADEEICGEGAAGQRESISAEQRAFGKDFGKKKD